MVKFVAKKGVNLESLEELELLIGNPKIKNKKKDSFTLKDGDLKLEIEGSGFDYIGGIPVSGKIEKIEAFQSGKLAYTLKKLNLKISDLGSFGSVEDALASILKGDDRLIGSDKKDTLLGFNGDDVIKGNKGGDTLGGQKGKDTLKGGNGKDVLDGGENKDTLEGGKGKDSFAFTTAADGKGDRILDFEAGERILLDNNVFDVGAAGATLDPSLFVEGSEATNANHRIVALESKGKIWYDDDGDGANAKVLLAKVTPGTNLDADNFFVI
ncbi:calcium-binding protein [Bauldia sp.]|uniref:calcium-binding protein n=1 Tax=Bauldia sp. TaxID=2575872 RepID=UPI003BAD914F